MRIFITSDLLAATMFLEIACFNLGSALTAQRCGADRIEFCADYKAGGITPSFEQITEARKKIHIPLHVIIRPRGGDFCYTVAETEEMKKAILFCREQLIDGVVFGILNNQKEADEAKCRSLLQYCSGMKSVFHRAIDETPDPLRSTEMIADLGFDAILSSGGKKSAPDGAAILTEMVQQAGNRIKIIAGGGIRSENLNELISTGCSHFHSSAITSGEAANEQEIIKLKKILKG